MRHHFCSRNHSTNHDLEYHRHAHNNLCLCHHFYRPRRHHHSNSLYHHQLLFNLNLNLNLKQFHSCHDFHRLSPCSILGVAKLIHQPLPQPLPQPQPQPVPVVLILHHHFHCRLLCHWLLARSSSHSMSRTLRKQRSIELSCAFETIGTRWQSGRISHRCKSIGCGSVRTFCRQSHASIHLNPTALHHPTTTLPVPMQPPPPTLRNLKNSLSSCCSNSRVSTSIHMGSHGHAHPIHIRLLPALLIRRRTFGVRSLPKPHTLGPIPIRISKPLLVRTTRYNPLPPLPPLPPPCRHHRDRAATPPSRLPLRVTLTAFREIHCCTRHHSSIHPIRSRVSTSIATGPRLHPSEAMPLS
jgi:hypothetical protein